jgi:DNA polymerase-3 subunit epsilon
MLQDAMNLAAMADALSLSPDYRVLRRLVPRLPSTPSTGQAARTAALLDTETTGLDHAKHEIIELGMVKFDYTPDGRIAGVRDTFSAFTSRATRFRLRLRHSRVSPRTRWPAKGSTRRP